MMFLELERKRWGDRETTRGGMSRVRESESEDKLGRTESI